MNLFSPKEARLNGQAGMDEKAPLSCHGGRMLKK
jgi:hypothetical protein